MSPAKPSTTDYDWEASLVELGSENEEGVTMSQEPAYMRNLKAITRAEPQVTDLELIEKELYFSGSDRATAVMFGSFVEANLGRLLTSAMRGDLNSKERKQFQRRRSRVFEHFAFF